MSIFRLKMEIDQLIENGYLTTEFENYRQNIFIALVNYERNKELVSSCPHFMMNDLVVLYKLKLNDTACATINNELMDLWKVNSSELHEAAIKNAPFINPLRQTAMNDDLIADMMVGNHENLFKDTELNPDGLNILTNTDNFFGASVILYPGVLDTVKKVLGEFYIIPSSINEVLVISKKVFAGEKHPEMVLRDLIRNVNHTLNGKEVLSDNLYLYDGTKIKVA